MKNKSSLIIFISSIVSLALLIYLSIKHIALKTGSLTEGSLCNINATFNCDAVSASIYSELFGIPISLWGFFSNFIFLVLFSIYKLSHSDKALSYSFLLSSFNFFVCLVYGFISLFVINTYCLFCIISYISVGITFFAVLFIYKASKPESIKLALFDLFKDSKVYLGLLISIPISAFIFNDILLGDSYKDLQKNIRFMIQSWQSQPIQDIPLLDAIIIGDEDAKMVIVEFADYNCIHCKLAAPSLHSFVKSHRGTQLRFYNFPLDSNCNLAISRPGRSCEMAKAVQCSYMLEPQNAWRAKQAMFETKTSLDRKDSMDLVIRNTNIELSDLEACVNGDEVLNIIMQQAKLGETIGVKGTPAIFINGKFIQGGHLLPVLREVYRELR